MLTTQSVLSASSVHSTLPMTPSRTERCVDDMKVEKTRLMSLVTPGIRVCQVSDSLGILSLVE